MNQRGGPKTKATSGGNAPAASAAMRRRNGFTLVEMLIAIAVMAIVAGMLIPYASSMLPDQLRAGVQVVAADIDYARNLAIANSTKYRYTFQPSSNNYYLEHSGTNVLFNPLPKSPYRSATDTATRQTTEVAKLPLGGTTLELIVAQLEGTNTTVTTLEFQPLGNTTATAATRLWFGCGQGANRRYLPLRIDPITGLAEPGALTAVHPVTGVVASGS